MLIHAVMMLRAYQSKSEEYFNWIICYVGPIKYSIRIILAVSAFIK